MYNQKIILWYVSNVTVGVVTHVRNKIAAFTGGHIMW